MRKRYLTIVVTLSLCIVACGGLPVSTSSYPKLVSQHISGLTLYDGKLYFGAGYSLYSLDTRTQDLNEIVRTQDWTFQRPAVDEERAYVQVLTSPNAAMFFVSVDLSSGGTAWRVDESTGIGPYWRDVKDHTYMINGQVITIHGERFETELRIHAFDAQAGHQIWRTELNYFQSKPHPFLFHDGLVWYIVDTDKHRAENGTVVGIDASTGKVQQVLDPRSYGKKLDSLLYVGDRWVFSLYDSRYILAIDRTRPSEVAWQSERLLSGSVPADQAFLYNDLFIVPIGGLVYALDVEIGRTEWIFDPDAESVFAEEFEHVALFVLPGTHDSVLYALDAASGAALWQYALSPRESSGPQSVPSHSPPRPVVSGNTVYIANKDSIDALDLYTGELLWQVKVDSEYEYLFDPY